MLYYKVLDGTVNLLLCEVPVWQQLTTDFLPELNAKSWRQEQQVAKNCPSLVLRNLVKAVPLQGDALGCFPKWARC